MSKIRLYDFLSFLLPGLLVTSSVVFFLSYVVPVLPEGVRFKDLNSLGGSIVFLLLAFIVGHAVQVVGNSWEVRQIRYWGRRPLKTAKHPQAGPKPEVWAAFVSFWATVLPALRFVPIIRPRIKEELGLVENENGGWYSRQLLRDTDPTYDADTKKWIREGAEAALGVSAESGNQASDRKNQLIFDRAYMLVLQKNVAPHTEDFNSQYGFYRGCCVGFVIMRWMAVLSLVAIGLFFLNEGIDTCEFTSRSGTALATFLGTDFLYFLFRKRYERFAFYFANSVFQNFLVWWVSEKAKR
jgi:hypothetical protein